MSYEMMSTCAAITLATAIEDLAEDSGRPIEEIRKEFLESTAYECLLDFDSGLWAEGPDSFREYYRRTMSKKSFAGAQKHQRTGDA